MAAPQKQAGPKSWVIWMLFGLGWPSLLFWGLNLLRLNPTAKWFMWAFGWVFLSCWWAGALMGLGHTSNRRVNRAWTSCIIMAVIGTTMGAVPSLTVALYRNWYALQSLAVAVAIYLAACAYESNSSSNKDKGSAAENAAATKGAAGSIPGEEEEAEESAGPAVVPATSAAAAATQESAVGAAAFS